MTSEQFIDLVRTEQEPLRRFLLALCGGDQALADDIAQDALVRAYVASGSFLGRSKFRTWLFRIAYNCYIDNFRKKTPVRVDPESYEAQSIPSGDSADSRFRYQQLYQALERIPEKLIPKKRELIEELKGRIAAGTQANAAAGAALPNPGKGKDGNSPFLFRGQEHQGNSRHNGYAHRHGKI